MTEENLISLALAAGFSVEEDGSITDGVETAQHLNDELRYFAQLVIADERDRIANACWDRRGHFASDQSAIAFAELVRQGVVTK